METNNSQLIIYQTPQEDTHIDVRVKGDTIWLTQRQIAELFGTKVPAIPKHIKNIFASGELQEDTVISKVETTTRHCGHAIPVVPQRLWNPLCNGILYNEDGSKRIADNTLVALTLIIAESRTEEKDTMVKVIVNLINKNN